MPPLFKTQAPAAKVSAKPAAAKPAAAKKGDVMGKKMGGIDWAAIDKQAKIDAKKQKKAMANDPDAGKSKIFMALNQKSLWKETKAEKEAKADDDNIMVVDVRGGGGMGAFAVEDAQVERDDAGNIVVDETYESESDVEDGDLADFDPDTMDELTRKRMERAREAEDRRKVLRKQSIELKQREQKELDKQLATIAKQKAAENKKEGITDKDVKATQKRLEEELTFEGFGFGD